MNSSSWQQKETETRMAVVPSECTAIDTKKRTAAGGGGAEKKKKPPPLKLVSTTTGTAAATDGGSTTSSDKIAILEEKFARAARLEISTINELALFEAEADPAVKCYSLAMHHLKNIVDFPGYEKDEKNEILLDLRASYDKFETKYKPLSQAYEEERRSKIKAYNSAVENKQRLQAELARAIGSACFSRHD